MKGGIYMQGVIVNVMKKAKQTQAVANMHGHNAQIGKATGNRDDSLRKYNFDVLAMQGEATVDNYNKYFKTHAHVGYNAHQEELAEGDFVVPRLYDKVSRVESIIVCPPTKVLLSEIDKFDFSEVQLFFDDYINNFIRKDEKFKDVKILSAKVHCNEVYYPRFEEVKQPDGTSKLKRLSREESIKRAYVKVHMHMDFIPLVQAEKGGKTFLKLSSNDLWKAKGRYFKSYTEYNDRCHDAVGKEYGLDRGQKWVDWDERVQKKENGEAVKEARTLADWQLDKDEEETQRYIAQLEEEKAKATDEARKQIEAEIEAVKAESTKEFERKQHEYAMQLKQMEVQKQRSEAEVDAIRKRKQQMVDEYNKKVAEYDELQAEIDAGMEQLRSKKEWIDKMFDVLDDEAKVFVNIELRLKEKSITPQKALQDIVEMGLDEKLKHFKEQSAREHTPNLHRLAQDREDR